jgi:hypothetical protein
MQNYSLYVYIRPFLFWPMCRVDCRKMGNHLKVQLASPAVLLLFVFFFNRFKKILRSKIEMT